MASMTLYMLAQDIQTSSIELICPTPLMTEVICFLSLLVILQFILLHSSSSLLDAAFTIAQLVCRAYWKGLIDADF
jgi:hypothetical protein